MNEKRLEILKKAGEALIPAKEGLPDYSAEVDERIEKLLSRAPPYIRIAINICLLFLQLLPIFRIFRLKKPSLFTSLTVEERYRLLDWLRRSRFYFFRGIFIIIKLFAVALYTSREDVERAIGYSVSINSKKSSKKVPSPYLVMENVIEGHLESNKNFRISCDILVVGSGAGGAVVAKELAERGFDVAVVEEGFMPECDKLGGEMLEVTPELYRDAGMTFTLPPIGTSLHPSVLLPTGVALGGTTVVNEGTCFRTPDEVLEKWSSEFGLEGIDPKTMSRYFRKVERTLNVHPVSAALIGEAAMKVAAGAEKLGYDYFPLYKNMTGCEGLGLCEFCCPIDAKRTMHLSYIPLATQIGAKFYTGFRAKWLEFRGRRITKVGGEIVDRGGRVTGRFVAEFKILVLAAGAIHTPYLLLKNGVANSSGMVGKNLRIHPVIAVMGIFDETLRGWDGMSQSLAVKEFADEGIIMETTFAPPGIAMAGNWLVGEELSEILLNYKKASMLGVMVGESDSRGRVIALPDFLPYFGEKPYRAVQIWEKGCAEGSEGVSRGMQNIFCCRGG